MSSRRADKTVQVQVKNLKEVQRRLRAVGDDAVKDLKKAHGEAARVVEGQAKIEVPVKRIGTGDSAYIRRGAVPGRLKQSIRSSGQARAGVVRAGTKALPYAGVVHYGWPNRPNYGMWNGKIVWGGPIRENKFLYRALLKKEDEVEEIFVRLVNEAIDRHLGG
ncbi:MAG TPA: hypothetical protein VIG24_03425 [Acidimicrobiia bacterium]